MPNPLQTTTNVTTLSYTTIPDFLKCVSRFPVFARIFFRQQKHLHEDECGALVELYGQGKTELLGQ